MRKENLKRKFDQLEKLFMKMKNLA